MTTYNTNDNFEPEYKLDEDDLAIILKARNIANRLITSGRQITCPEDIFKILLPYQLTRKDEHFDIIWLNNSHIILTTDISFFKGTIDNCHIPIRSIIRRALHLNAAAVVIAHNHPSGTPEPSQGDIAITKRLKSILIELDIRLLDHIITSGGTYTSLATRNLI